MKKLLPALFGQALIALVISAAVFAFQARPGYFTTLDVTGTATFTGSVVGAMPANVIVFSSAGTCPTGFTEYTQLRGRYPVGLVSGGTNAGTSGTALTDLEARAVGQHTHSLTDPGHNHTQNAHTHTVNITDPGHIHTSLGDPASAGGSPQNTFLTTSNTGSTISTASATTGVTAAAVSATATNNSATTGITAANAGSVAGTNAPYIQLIACRKS
jgi:hypothetical protein